MSAGELKTLRAAYFAAKRWKPDAELTVGFIADPPADIRIPNYNKAPTTLPIDPLQQEIMKDATFDYTKIKAFIQRIVAERIQPIVGLKISFVPDAIASTAKIRIAFNPTAGAYSYIGTDCLQVSSPETMNLGWFDVATTMHEFGHALGMIHEHQNPDSNPIQWNKEAVYQWAKETQGWTPEEANTQIIDSYYAGDITGSAFDPDSIMLYFFPASLTLNNQGTHQNLRLSPNDVIWLANSYPNGALKPEEFYLKTYGTQLSTTTTAPPTTTTAAPTTNQPTTTTTAPTTTAPTTAAPTTAAPTTAAPTTAAPCERNETLHTLALVAMLVSFLSMILIVLLMK